MNLVSQPETIQFFNEQYDACSIRYGDMKKQLAEDMIIFTTPYREKIKTLINDDAYLKKIALAGKEKARESASKTIKEVREIIGFRSF